MVSIIRKNVFWSVSATIIKNIFYVLAYIIFARTISPESMGVVSVTLVASGATQTLIDSGFINGIIRLPELDNRRFSSIYWFCVTLGCSASLILATSGYILSFVTHVPLYATLFLTASLTGVVNSLGQFFFALLYRRIDFKSVAFVESGSSLVTLISLLLLMSTGADENAFFISIFLGMVTQAILSFLFARGQFVPSFHFDFADIRENSSFGFYNTLERLVSFISFNLEKPLIASLFSLEVLGYYTIINQIVTRPLIFFSAAFSRVAYPVCVKLQNNHAALNTFYIKSISSLALLTFPIYGMITIVAEPVIEILFGKQYLPATHFVLPMCILGAIWSIGNPLGSYLMALNRAKAGFLLNLFISVLTFLLYALFHSRGLSSMLWFWIVIQLLILIPIEFSMMANFTKLNFSLYIKEVLPHALVVFTLSLIIHYFPFGSSVLYSNYITITVYVGAFFSVYLLYFYSIKKLRKHVTE